VWVRGKSGDDIKGLPINIHSYRKTTNREKISWMYTYALIYFFGGFSGTSSFHM